MKTKIGGDILALSPSILEEGVISQKIPRIDGVDVNIGSKLTVQYAEHPWVYTDAWKYRFRSFMRNKRFLSAGQSYLPPQQLSTPTTMKKSFRISPEVVNGVPSLWVDPGTRVMVPLTSEEAKWASEENEIPVRVLMEWRSAFVVGVYPESVGQFRQMNLTDLWRSRGVPVNDNESVYKVRFFTGSQPYSYPQSCVFKEYEQGRMAVGIPKYPPPKRIEIVNDFLRESVGSIGFLGRQFQFVVDPIAGNVIAERSSQFESGRDFEIILMKNGKQHPVRVSDVQNEFLSGAEPYTGKKSGPYYVVCPARLRNEVEPALEKLESTYSQLNMGTLTMAAPIRFVSSDTQSQYREAFNLTMNDILRSGHDDCVVIVILPSVSWQNSLFYAAKDAFFNPPSVIERRKPIQIQCIEEDTVRRLPSSNAIAYNIIPQLYLKLFGRNAAVWLCRRAADSYLYPFNSGITAYACFDVSRRKKLKAQVSVFTAVTDGYGRFITYDKIPAGGENLTPLAFEKLIEKIAQVCKQYADIFALRERNLPFNLRRIVFYKDGQIDRREAEMMKAVFEDGIPEEGIQPLAQHFANRQDLPESLAIDIIGVNKSSIKRVLMKEGYAWSNPKRGLCLTERGGKSALLVGSQAQKRGIEELNTLQPLLIEHIHHFTINSSLPAPRVEDLAREYYHLTFLDWVTFYQRSKFALPQRITQKTGEYLSSQVDVPKEVTLI